MAIGTASTVVNASLPSTQATFYDSVAVDALFANLVMQRHLTTTRELPKKKGKTIQLFGYSQTAFTSGVSAGNTPPTATEGTVGTPIVPTQASVSAVLGQYVDFITVSDMALDVSIDPMLEFLADHLGYRGAMVADTLVQLQLDAGLSTDASAGYDLGYQSVMTGNVVRAQTASLEGRNPKAFGDGYFHGVMHPFVMGDFLNDTTNNSVVDVIKHSGDGINEVREGNADGKRPFLWAGVMWLTSTNLPATANYQSQTGVTAFSNYISAKDAVFSIGLGNTEVPQDRNFKVKVMQFGADKLDPGGQIAGAVSYNFKNVVAPRTGTTYVYKRIRAVSAIS